VKTILQVLERTAESCALKDILEFEGAASYSAEALVTNSSKFASIIQALGVNPGERVAIMAGNRAEFIWATFGSIYAGAVPAPLNVGFKGPILDLMLSKLAPSLVIVEASTSSAVRDSLDRTGLTPSVIDLDEASRSTDSLALGPAMAAAAQGHRRESNADELALIMYTSGTTGPSKGAMLSHGMALEFGDFAKWLFDFDSSDVMYNCLPLFHANSLLLTLLGAVRVEGKAVFGETFSATSYWTSVRESGATIVSLLGSMFPILWNRPPSPDDTKHNARIGLTVPSPRDHFYDFQDRFGLRLTALYGVSDVGMPIGVPAGTDARPGKAGILHPHWECKLVDDNGDEVTAGESGQLLMRPLKPNITQLGYWAAPVETLKARKEGWFNTGDALVCDEEGWYTFVDRRSDAIRRSGENISSFEVEMVLQDHPAVAEVAVIGVPSELGEQEVVAVVVVEAGADLQESALVAYAEETLPYFAVPRYVRLVDALPKTATAKVRKDLLRDAGCPEGTFDAGARGRRATKSGAR
jgi:carnitine-CoA ligase